MTARADALDEIPEELFGAIERAQRDAYRQVSKLLGRLDLNSAGNIELTTKNLALIEQIAGVTNQTLFTGEYINAVRDFAAKIETQSQFAAKYMDQAFGSFTDNDIYQQILRTSQADAVALLNENAVNQALVEPIKQSLRNSVTTNASFPDAVKNIQQIMIGSAERESNLLGNRKTLIKDAFTEADRRYNIAIEDQYEFEWYRYAGGRVEDTRCFCQKRANKYYRRSEIESWGRLENLGECRTSNGWAGRIPGTNERSIFTYVGGYNCNHIIVAVPEEAVPESQKDVIIVEQEKGSYFSGKNLNNELEPSKLYGQKNLVKDFEDFKQDLKKNGMPISNYTDKNFGMIYNSKKQGWLGKKVTTISDEEVFRRVKEPSSKPMIRGYGDDTVNRHNSFVDGKTKYIPKGVYGDGYYYAVAKNKSNYDSAVSIAKGYTNDDKMSVSFIKKDAKVSSFDDIFQEFQDFQDDQQDATSELRGKLKKDGKFDWDSFGSMNMIDEIRRSEVGAYAANKGVDVIIANVGLDMEYYVVLNPTAIETSKSVFDTKTLLSLIK